MEIETTAAGLPIQREVKIGPCGRAHGVGKRKSSMAKVWVKPGEGHIVINGKPITEYFSRGVYQADIDKPFQAIGVKFDVVGVAAGGGLTGQAGAVRLAISRAIVNFNPDFYPSLRSMGLMTFDTRRVERKKCGLVKARKAKPTSRR